MNEVALVDVLDSTKDLFEELKVSVSVYESLGVLEHLLKRESRAVLHLNHEVNGYEFLVLPDKFYQSLVIKHAYVR